jgi:hypothetical protein
MEEISQTTQEIREQNLKLYEDMYGGLEEAAYDSERKFDNYDTSRLKKKSKDVFTHEYFKQEVGDALNMFKNAMRLNIRKDFSLMGDIINCLSETELKSIDKKNFLYSFLITDDTPNMDINKNILDIVLKFDLSKNKNKERNESLYNIIRYVDFLRAKLKILRLRRLYNFNVNEYFIGKKMTDIDNILRIYINIIMLLHGLNYKLLIYKYDNVELMREMYFGAAPKTEETYNFIKNNFSIHIMKFVNQICERFKLNIISIDDKTYSITIPMNNYNEEELSIQNNIIEQPFRIILSPDSKIKFPDNVFDMDYDKNSEININIILLSKFFIENTLRLRPEYERDLLDLFIRYGIKWF